MDLIDNYLAPDGSTRLETPDGLRKNVAWLHKICTNLKVTFLDMLAEGDKVMVYFQADITCTSKYLSEYSGDYPPLDQPHSWKGMEIYRIVDGKMVSRLGVYDPEHLHHPRRKTA